MSAKIWIALSLVISILIGISSGLVTNIIWPSVMSKVRSVWAAFFVFSMIGVILAILPVQGALFHPKSWNLVAGQTLYLTTGGFRYKDYQCGDNPKQLCVLLLSSSYAQTITVNDLPIKVGYDGSVQPLYYDSIRDINPDQILAEQEVRFWSQTNCGTGCTKATIVKIEDGVIGQPIIMDKP